jgi:ParB family transcriptional regulator, chromosome partitioning protein
MAKSVDEAYGAESRGTSVMMFAPEKLKLVRDKKHLLYDPRVEVAVNEQLVASIMFRGVMIPVRVWKDVDTGEVLVVDGRQRVKAAVEANKRLRKQGEPEKHVPGIALKSLPQHALGAMVLLNEGRLEPTPIERANAAQRLLDSGYSEEQAATILHATPASFKNYLSLLKCTTTVRSAIEAGKLAPTYAYQLSKLKPAEQKEKLEKLLKAAGNVKGKHARGRKMRAASGEKTKMRSRKEILAMIKTFGATPEGTVAPIVAVALRWVLGEDVSVPDDVPEKQVNGVSEAAPS